MAMQGHTMQMMSMKRPKDGHPGSEMAMPAKGEEGPHYGYGLMLRLENFELEKLKLKKLEVGQKLEIHAMGVVDNVHESQSMHNKGDRSVGIQITDLAVARPEKK